MGRLVEFVDLQDWPLDKNPQCLITYLPTYLILFVSSSSLAPLTSCSLVLVSVAVIVLRCEIASPSHQSGVKYEMKV